MVAISTQHRGRKAAEYSSPEQIVPSAKDMSMLIEDGKSSSRKEQPALTLYYDHAQLYIQQSIKLTIKKPKAKHDTDERGVEPKDIEHLMPNTSPS